MTKPRRHTTRLRPPDRTARPDSARRTTTSASRRAGDVDDAFFRHIVAGMRNGVLVLTREGRLTLINDEA